MIGWMSPAPAAEPEPLPPNTLLLLVAARCAPCRGELARLDAIAEAAGPVAVRVVPLDGNPATRRMLANVPAWRIDATPRVVERVASRTGGLPFSLMTDAAGRPCAEHARPLDAAGVRAMRRSCGI